MLVTLDWIHYHYYKFNREYFGDLLPSIEFKISRSKQTWGYAEFRYDYPNNTIIPLSITMSNYFDSPEEVKLNTLLHEMIHIADYTFNPHHFVMNHKKVNGHRYDAHGWWFKQECNRLKEYGWEIEKYVSEESKSISSLSERSIRCLNNKKSVCLVCVIKSENKAFAMKTDIHKINDIKKSIKRIPFWQWKGFLNGSDITVTFYQTNNERLASKRSCCTKLTGKNMPISYLKDYLDSYDCKKYNIEYKIAA